MQTTTTSAGQTRSGRVAVFFKGLTRTQLLYLIGYVCLGLLSLSLLITAIAQSRKKDSANPPPSPPPAPNTTTDDVCLTQGCISAATHQLRSMDSAGQAGRCSDFYQYACGGWQQTHPIESYEVERTILGDILDRRDAEIERLLDAPISRIGEDSWEYKLKTYYTECVDDYARTRDSSSYMIGIINDPNTVNGWFLFDNSAENASQEFLTKNQTLYQQLSHIHGDLGVLAVFGLRARFDEADSSIKRLDFYPAGLSMEINDYLGNDSVSESRRAAYQLYIVDVLGMLARDASITDQKLGDRAFIIARDVFDVERYLAESLQHNPFNSQPYITNLQDMSNEFQFDFPALIAHELSDPSVLSILTPVYLTNRGYFQEVFEYLRKNDDPLLARIIHNYLRWRLVWTYIDDLSYQYVHAHRIFLQAYYGYALHTTNEAYCTREVIRRFPLAIQRLYTMNSVRPANTTSAVDHVFAALKDGLKQYINNQTTWMPDEPTKAYARAKIDALTAAIGYATIASNDDSLDKYYDKFGVSDESHFMNTINYHQFHRWSLSASLANSTILDHWDLFEARPSRLFDYIAVFNQLFVIASGLHEPLTRSLATIRHAHHKILLSRSMNMGSIGVLLAQKLFSSLDGPEGRTHLANGTRFDWWAMPTVHAYNVSRNCITNYYVNDVKSVKYNINGVSVDVRLAGEPFSPTTVRHIGALRFAYNALMKTDTMKTIKMPGTNFTSEQTFFLAYAQTQCYQRQELLQLVRTQLGIYDERTALNAALFHMPEFAQAFRCPTRPEQCLDF